MYPRLLVSARIGVMVLAALLWALACGPAAAVDGPAKAAAPAAAASQPNLRLRISWSLADEEPVALRLRCAGGRFDRVQNLCLSPHTTGAFAIDANQQTLRFAPRSRVPAGAFDVTLQADPNATLVCELVPTTPSSAAEAAAAEAPASDVPAAGSPPQPITHSLSLAAIGEAAQQIDVSGHGRISIRRAPGDAIDVDFRRTALVFWTGERAPLTLSVRPSEELQAGETLQTRLTVRHARGGTVVAERSWEIVADEQGRLPPLDIDDLVLPEQEGAYDLHWSCVRRRASALDLLKTDLSPLRGEKTLASRSVQVAVLAAQTPATDARPFREIGKIQPLRRSWSIPRLLPGVAEGLWKNEEPTASGPLGEELHAGEPIAVLAPGGWYASPLPIEHLNRPHLVTVRYPRSQSMQLGISIAQRDASGTLPPLGTDSGVAASVAVDPTSDRPWAEHRIVFWPHDRRPYLILTNQDAHEPVRFESITVEAGPLRLVDDLRSTGGAASADVSSPAGSADLAQGRLAALYLDKPLLPEFFGDGGHLDADSTLVVEDWQTFLVAGNRLVDYVKWAGYNGAIVTVASDGGGLYPSSHLHTTPRFDSGLFASTGQDPVSKDVLELLMRLFDRAGLRLVPAVEWSTPLPAIEATLRTGSAPAGVQPIDIHGRAYWHQPDASAADVPYYNALHPLVRQTLLEATEELVRRYEAHPSFAGVGLHLGPHTHVQLPDARWTQDADTLARFAAEHPQVPSDPARLKSWLQAEGAEAFAAWRAEQLTELYAQQAARTGGRPLLLLAADRTGSVVDDYQAGLDWQRIGQCENVVPLRLIREAVFRDVVQQAADARRNESSKWDRQLATARAAGALIYRPAQETRNADLSNRGPPALAGGRRRWYTHAVPSAQRYRHQLIRSLDGFDAQVLAVGGWGPALGQEDATRETLRTFAALPAGVMQPVAGGNEATSCVRLRKSVHRDHTYVAAVNVSPWPTVLQVVFAQPIEAVSLPAGPTASGADSSFSGQRWQIMLQPGQLAALKIEGPASIRRWSEHPPGGDQFLHQLSESVQNLAARVAMLADPRIYPELANASFAETAPRAIPAWMHAQHPADSVQLASGGSDDDYCVLLTNRPGASAKTWIVSTPFPAPTTGRLAVSLQARCPATQSGADPPTLRIGIEGQSRGRPLRRSVTVTPAADGQWQPQPLWLEVEDLGGDTIEDLRLTIDLLSPGQIWIDDVKLYDFFLTEAERSRLQSQVFLAVQRIRQEDLTAAAKLFDSHWGRYLMNLRVPVKATVQSRAEEPVASPPDNPAPGIAERVKGWLPSPIRF